jgi:hypothetical protein
MHNAFWIRSEKVDLAEETWQFSTTTRGRSVMPFEIAMSMDEVARSFCLMWARNAYLTAVVPRTLRLVLGSLFIQEQI